MSSLDILAQAASMAAAPPPSESGKSNKSGSNIADLPPDVRRYIELTHRKQVLLDEIKQIQTELKPMQSPTMEKMLHDSLQSIQICPSKEEEAKYGAIGALQMKVKNDYESLTRDNLVRLTTEFYEYLLKGSNPEELIQLGQGTASWLWSNRRRVPIRYLERTFAIKPEKRKAPAASEQQQPAAKIPRARFKPVTNMPHTREDFLGIPAMQTMIKSGSGSNLPNTFDADEGGGDAEDNFEDE